MLISTDALIETRSPHLVSIGDRVFIGIRVLIIAHFQGVAGKDPGKPTVTIEHDAFIGPGVIILPNVTIGHGAVVSAGSVVTRSIPPLTLARGNPAVPIMRCGIPLSRTTLAEEFYQKLIPLRDKDSR